MGSHKIVPGTGIPVNEAKLWKSTQHFYPHNSTAGDMVYKRYSNRRKYPILEEAMSEMLTHALFLCPTRRMLEALDSQGMPGYFYYGDQEERSWPIWYMLGDFHALDIMHLFDDHIPLQYWSKMDKLIGQYMRFTFHNFGVKNSPGVNNWRPYTSATKAGIGLDKKLKPTHVVSKNGDCDFWDSLGANLWQGLDEGTDALRENQKKRSS